MDSTGTGYRLLDQVRIFPNRPDVRWNYRVHEQILPSVHRAGGGVRWTEIIIDHTGYQDPSLRKHKLDRNLRLLRMDHAEHPDDSFTLFNLGWTLMDLGEQEESLHCLRRALELATPDASIVRKLYVLIGQLYRHLKNRQEAKNFYREGLTKFPDDTELLFEEATLNLDDRDLDAAEDSLVKLIEGRPSRYFGSIDVGMRGFKARHLLADVYRQQDRASESELQWRTALKERPDYVPARLGLGDLYIKQGRWAELDQLTHNLEEQGMVVEGTILRSRSCAARREFTSARRLLEDAIPRFPKALGLRLLLTHVLIQEGRDWAGAEKALRDLLALDPDHPEANRNLQVLLQQQNRSTSQLVLSP